MMLARPLSAVVLIMALVSAARAQVIDVRKFALEPAEDGYVVNADFEFDLTARLEEALNSGVALYFVVEFELTRPRWYWFDERAASERLELRLSYNPLLRQYRLSTGSLHLASSSLADATNLMTRVRSWPVLERDRVQPDRSYVASLRMRLDTAQLPRPFQLSAMTDRDWNLASPWKRIAFVPVEAERAHK